MDIKACGDHIRYLDRMSQSLNESTKSLLPIYIKGKKRILDVGCADGAMMTKLMENDPEAKVYGIDICDESIRICESKGLNVFKTDIVNFAGGTGLCFDAIIFSSVLHEISSYADEDRYDKKHIYKALESAKKLLSNNGVIIIRDGIKASSNKNVSFSFKDNNDYKYIKEFVNTPIFREDDWQISMCTKDKYVIQMSEENFKEFLFTYTWGKESWARESQERFGILTVEEWLRTVVDCNLKLEFMTTSSEQYVKRLSKKIECDKLNDVLAECTITMILSRN